LGRIRGDSWRHVPSVGGRARAKELFFTARKVKAEEALELGIIERLTEPGEHLTTALAMAQEIISNSSPLGAAAVKQMVNLGSEMSVAEAHVLNDLLRRPLEGTKDYEEGIRAFFEKRQPVWQGE
jgi:Enoyl-CoA hydratase/carnithine racemase